MRKRLASALPWTTAAAVVPVAALHFFGREKVYLPGAVHFASVTAGALIATAAAVVLTAKGVRQRDGCVVLLATGFTVMATLLAVHGLSTPGLIIGNNGIVAFTGAGTLPIGATILALSAHPSLRRPQSVRPLLFLQAALIVAIAALAFVGMLVPKLVPGVPSPNSPGALALLAAGLLFYAILGWRALRTFLLTRRNADFAIVCGLAWLATALVAALTLGYWNVGWWFGHALEVAGILLVGGVVAFDLRRSARSLPLVGDLRTASLVRSEEAFLGSHVRALMLRLAEKDEYTEGHTRRVALLAVQVGEELGLGANKLRALAAGGLLHDIGKLSVPDEILKKPGPLTDEEFAVIRRHPQRGDRLLAELGGFSQDVHCLVRGHHERLNGSGYPDRLTADGLDLPVRILGACDVYDALVSTRVYRDAWTSERALDLLRAEAGTCFDTRCVAALERIVSRAAESSAPSPAPAPRPGTAPARTPLIPGAATVFAASPPPLPPRDP